MEEVSKEEEKVLTTFYFINQRLVAAGYDVYITTKEFIVSLNGAVMHRTNNVFDLAQWGNSFLPAEDQ